MLYLPEVPDPKDTLTAIFVTLEAAPVAVGFQVIFTDFDKSVCTTNSNHSILIYIAMPLGDDIMSNLEILCNMIYKEGVKYAVSVYNISVKAYRKLPDGLAVL